MVGRPLSRRTALAGAATAPLAVTACDIDPPADRSEPAGPSGLPPGDDADDVDLVTEVLQRLDATAVVVSAAATRPATADLAARLTVLHQAQVAVLGGAVPDASSSGDVVEDDPGQDPASPEPTPGPTDDPGDTAGGPPGLVPAERAMQRTFVGAARAARSGDLARVLASAAAAIAQELALHDLSRSRP